MIEFDKTALDMAIIPKDAIETLLGADENSIRLYLYGLLFKSAEVEQILKATGLTKDELFDAMENLQRLGLYSIGAYGGKFIYSSAKEHIEIAGDDLYKDAGFNSMLQALFSDRQLSYNDYKVFYELLDVYALPRQVILVLAEYCINKNRSGNRVKMSYIKEVGKSWAKEGIHTLEQAEAKVLSENGAAGGAREILKTLKISRLPTEQEEELYKKWQEEWGFSFAAIKAATAATTGAQYPTFKYLDGILKSLHGEGLLSSAEINEHFELVERSDEILKGFLKAFSSPRLTVSPDQREKFLQWQRMGYGKKEMELACRTALERGRNSIDYMDTLLRGWKEIGLKTRPDIEAQLQKEHKRQAAAKKLLEEAGVKKRVARADEELYARYAEIFPDEVIYFAAKCAYGLPLPLKSMQVILDRWKQAGVATLIEAEQENERHKSGSGAKPRLSDISERPYDKAELDVQVKDGVAELFKDGSDE